MDFSGESIACRRHDTYDVQFEFLTYNFTVTELSECTLEEVEEMFYSVNQSVINIYREN